MKPSVIVHVPRRFALDEWGGTESVIYHLCRQQRFSGYQPEIHTSLALATKQREVWREIPIHRYPYTYPFLGLSEEEKHALDKKGGNLLSFSLFSHLLRKRNVRLFHAHVTKRMGATVRSVSRLRNKPFVVTLHGNMFDVPMAEAESLVAAQQGHFEWGRPFGLLLGSRHLLERADAIICVGYSEYQSACQHLPNERVHYLPNGVEPESFSNGHRERQRAALGIAPEDFCFGCVSRLDPQKNQALLIEAWKRVLHEHKHSHLILCGPSTNQQYVQDLESLIQQCPAPKRVHLLPPVEAESQAHQDLLSALDCFVLPSRHEPFGIVVLEAWSAGIPVIASNIGGLQRLVRHERNGLHFTPGDVEALADSMLRMIRDTPLREHCQKSGLFDVNATYHWKQINGKLEVIYQQAEATYRP